MFFINRLSRTSSVCLLASMLTFSFMVQAQVIESVPEVASEQMSSEQASETKQPVFHFPQWPNRKQVKKEIVPPPPPGPYMSSALSGHSIKAPSFSHRFNKPRMAFDSSNVSMDTFSPDIPWPTNLSPPSRWMPENGYQYVQPQVSKNRQQTAPINNQNGYRPQSPQMNWSGMRFNPNSGNNSANAPSMSMPDMRWPNNQPYDSKGPANWMPSEGYPVNRGQYRSYPGSTNASMSNRGPARQDARQGGLQ